MQALPGSSSRLALGSVPALVIYRPHLALASFRFVVVVVSSGMRRSPIHCSLPILVKSPGVSHVLVLYRYIMASSRNPLYSHTLCQPVLSALCDPSPLVKSSLKVVLS